MAQFQNMIITRAGLDMIAQSQAGGTLIFTKGKLGDGQIGDQSIPDLTDLINAKMSVGLSSVTAKSDGHVEVKFIVDNVNLDIGFFVREVGIFAKVNEEGVEKLYGYANAGNYTNYLSDKTVPIDSIITKIDLVVGNASDVAFTTDKSIIYVTLEDVENAFNIHNEDKEAHPNDFNLKGFTIGKDKVIAAKKGDLLTLLAGKGINLLSDIKNKIITIVGKSKNAWNPKEEIIAGDIRYTEDGNGPSWAYLLCKTKGTTGTVEPILAANAAVGQEINDGSVVWTVQNIRPTALDSYPVGSIYMSVNSTSPADLFGGTWKAMPAGRVLLAQGTSEWGVKYQAGSTGGEHKHQLSVGELPIHSHTATVSNEGNHNHLTGVCAVAADPGYFKEGSTYLGDWNKAREHGWGSNVYEGLTNSAGAHGHTVTNDNTGKGQSHNNMQPYMSIFMWKRVS